MNARDVIDYRPYLQMNTEVDAPAQAFEYENIPTAKLSASLSFFINNKPSLVLEHTQRTIESIQDKMRELETEDEMVRKFISENASAARKTLYGQLDTIEGNTNIIFHDRLSKVKTELERCHQTICDCFYDGKVQAEDLIELDDQLEKELVQKELGDEQYKINYLSMNRDMKILKLAEDYLKELAEFYVELLISSEPVEKNKAKIDEKAKGLYETKHEKVFKLLLEGKNTMDVNFQNELVLNRIRKVYNCRTRLLNFTAGLDAEARKKYEAQIEETKYELTTKLEESLRDLYKSVQLQRISLHDFKNGFRQKCGIIYTLKDGAPAQ